MTATQPKPTHSTGESTVYRAKVTGRHAITLPAELCRQLGIEVGDSVELEIKNGVVELRSASPVKILPVSELQGIMRGMFKDWDDIQRHVKELRDEWDDFAELEDDPLVVDRAAS